MRAIATGIAGALALAACGALGTPSTVTPTAEPPPRSERADAGEAKFIAVGCAACHGAHGEGGIGPRVSGTDMRLADVQLLVRSGAMDGAKYDNDELTDQDVANIYHWLQTKPAGKEPPVPDNP